MFEEIPKCAQGFIDGLREEIQSIVTGTPEIELYGSKRKSASGVSLLSMATLGISWAKGPSLFLIMRFRTIDPLIKKMSLVVPLYVLSEKEYGVIGRECFVGTMVDAKVPNAVACARFGFPKKIAFIPIKDHFTEQVSLYKDSDGWDPLTKTLNSDEFLLEMFRREKWKGSVYIARVEFPIEIKYMTQIVPFGNRTLIGMTYLTKIISKGLLKGIPSCRVMWSFEIMKKMGMHIKNIGHCEESKINYDFIYDKSMVFMDMLSGNGARFYNNMDLCEGIEQAISLFHSKKLKEAEREFREVLRMDPEEAKAHNYLGLIDACYGRMEESEKELKEAIKVDPEYADAHENLGVLLINSNRLEEGEKELREAVRLNPHSPTTHHSLGHALRKLERYEEAEVEFKEALRVDPNFQEAHGSLLSLFLETKRYDAAERQLRDALSRNPKNATAHAYLGYVLYHLEKYGEAEEEFKQALKMDPKSQMAQAFLLLKAQNKWLDE